MLTFKTKLHRQPVYLFDILQNYTSTRQLWSSSADLLKRQTTSTKTISDRAFSAAGTTFQWLYAPWHHLNSFLGVSRLIYMYLHYRLTDDYPYSGASDSMLHSFNYGAVNKWLIDWLIELEFVTIWCGEYTEYQCVQVSTWQTLVIGWVSLRLLGQVWKLTPSSVGNYMIWIHGPCDLRSLRVYVYTGWPS